MDRFTELPDGRIAYKVRHPLGPGKTHRVMTPVELLARLAALVPPPRFPLLRYFGVFAANSPWRPFVVPQPPDPTATCRHARAAEPAAFAPPRDPDEFPVSRPSRPAGPGPPSAGRPSDDGSPPSSDDFADPPWQEDCQLPPEGPEPCRRLYDDDSQVPPDAQD